MDENEQERTVWCGNLSSQCTEDIIYELFLQIAPLEKVKLCEDKEGIKQSYAFITFKHSISVNYSVNMLDGIKLFNRNIIVKQTNSNNSSMEAKPKQENTKSSNNSFEQFNGRIQVTSTPRERRNYNEDRHSDNRYNDDSRYKDNHSYKEKSRYTSSHRPHPYRRDKYERKTRFDKGHSY